MPGDHNDLPVHEVGPDDVGGRGVPAPDVESSSEQSLRSDTVEFGGSRRVGGLLALGVAGVATVAAIVLIAKHGGQHPIATPTRPTVTTLPASTRITFPSPTPTVTFPSPTPAVTVSAVPPAPAAALVAGRSVCFTTDETGRGGTIAFEIRNQLSHAVVVQRVSFARQSGVVVAATSIGLNPLSPQSCPEPGNLRPGAHYRAQPGSVWIAARLPTEPACGITLLSAWQVSFTDRGKTYQSRFSGLATLGFCLAPPHLSHG